MAKAFHVDDIEARQVNQPAASFRVRLCRRMMYRWLVARLQFTDDLLLHRQTPGNDVEFDPPLEGKAVDELLIVNSEVGSSAIPAPGIHRRRLSPGARHNLPC